MRPRVLACLPQVTQPWMKLSAPAGTSDPSHLLIFRLLKLYASDPTSDQDDPLNQVIHPAACTTAQSALLELNRWWASVERLRQTGGQPPDLRVSYRAFESIFGHVFDQADTPLYHRWTSLRSKLDLSSTITPVSFQEVSDFADRELTALVGQSGPPQDSRPRLIHTRRADQMSLKETGKGISVDGTTAGTPGPLLTPPLASQTPSPPKAGRVSSTTSTWARPCTAWKLGNCVKGISCLFKHEGTPVAENRCFVCRSWTHTSWECTSPGGRSDPEKERSWTEYRERRRAAVTAGKLEKGTRCDLRKGDKRGPALQGQPRRGITTPAQAATLVNAFVDVARVETADHSAVFVPRNGVAMDSWANVWLRYKKSMPQAYFQDTVQLAYGTCLGHRDVLDKGVPVVWLPWDAAKDNIDLFPEGFLWARGCTVTRGRQCWISTPKGRQFEVKTWKTLPYVTKKDLHQILYDLPATGRSCRSGWPTVQPLTARAARVLADLDLEESAASKEEVVSVRRPDVGQDLCGHIVANPPLVTAQLPQGGHIAATAPPNAAASCSRPPDGGRRMPPAPAQALKAVLDPSKVDGEDWTQADQVTYGTGHLGTERVEATNPTVLRIRLVKEPVAPEAEASSSGKSMGGTPPPLVSSMTGPPNQPGAFPEAEASPTGKSRIRGKSTPRESSAPGPFSQAGTGRQPLMGPARAPQAWHLSVPSVASGALVQTLGLTREAKTCSDRGWRAPRYSDAAPSAVSRGTGICTKFVRRPQSAPKSSVAAAPRLGCKRLAWTLSRLCPGASGRKSQLPPVLRSSRVSSAQNQPWGTRRSGAFPDDWEERAVPVPPATTYRHPEVPQGRAPRHCLSSGFPRTMATQPGELPRAAADAATQATLQEARPQAGRKGTARTLYSSRQRRWSAQAGRRPKRPRSGTPLPVKAAGDIDRTGPVSCPGLPTATGAQSLAITGLAADVDSSAPPRSQSLQRREEPGDSDWRRWTGWRRPLTDRETARETGEVPVIPPWCGTRPQGRASIEGIPGGGSDLPGSASSAPSTATGRPGADRPPPATAGSPQPETAPQAMQEHRGPPWALDARMPEARDRSGFSGPAVTSTSAGARVGMFLITLEGGGPNFTIRQTPGQKMDADPSTSGVRPQHGHLCSGLTSPSEQASSDYEGEGIALTPEASSRAAAKGDFHGHARKGGVSAPTHQAGHSPVPATQWDYARKAASLDPASSEDGERRVETRGYVRSRGAKTRATHLGQRRGASPLTGSALRYRSDGGKVTLIRPVPRDGEHRRTGWSPFHQGATMRSRVPARPRATPTSVSPGPANRGDIAGDGPSGRAATHGWVPVSRCRDGRIIWAQDAHLTEKGQLHRSPNRPTTAQQPLDLRYARVKHSPSPSGPRESWAAPPPPTRAAPPPPAPHTPRSRRRSRSMEQGTMEPAQPAPRPVRRPLTYCPVALTGVWADTDSHSPSEDLSSLSTEEVGDNPGRTGGAATLQEVAATGQAARVIDLTGPEPGPDLPSQGRTPLSERRSQLSRGSELHRWNQCKPCPWFWKPQGCWNGKDCRHCHMCPQGEVRRRRRARHSQQPVPPPGPAPVTPPWRCQGEEVTRAATPPASRGRPPVPPSQALAPLSTGRPPVESQQIADPPHSGEGQQQPVELHLNVIVLAPTLPRAAQDLVSDPAATRGVQAPRGASRPSDQEGHSSLQHRHRHRRRRRRRHSRGRSSSLSSRRSSAKRRRKRSRRGPTPHRPKKEAREDSRKRVLEVVPYLPPLLPGCPGGASRPASEDTRQPPSPARRNPFCRGGSYRLLGGQGADNPRLHRPRRRGRGHFRFQGGSEPTSSTGAHPDDHQ